MVGADVLLRDLHTWDTLYIAGRLHKPVLHLRRDAELIAAAEANVAAALAAGLLLLPGRFSTEVRRLRGWAAPRVCCGQPNLQRPAANDLDWYSSLQAFCYLWSSRRGRVLSGVNRTVGMIAAG